MLEGMIRVNNATVGDEGSVDVAAGTWGCVVYGPYAELTTGRLRGAFDITADVAKDLALIDVVTNSGSTVLVERKVTAGLTELAFELVVEFCVHALSKI
ncbi:MAG TPA: hypothetical protein DDY79_02285 [Brevundimonas sp.]|nr:hypothetical protein [Brevundimonas sp.]